MDYSLLTKQIVSVIENEKDFIANTSNISAILYDAIEDINWLGFYFIKDGGLVLGPFQGKVACTRINIGKGVCGTSVSRKKTQLIDDVHKFPGHIACDSASNSELVIPIIIKGEVKAVLDIDSTTFSRFSEEDQVGLENLIDEVKHYLWN
ncbi:GAF domain-containing protein [Metaclostridioides mangenotii]|uniref:GAF domain-containing protein n=1 Tax=Metaclostridioides mangenotii TaxID=1540 RepID=UPI0028E9FD2F|nr:GAF domain-containing protein [Clostridioides mangenotii]